MSGLIINLDDDARKIAEEYASAKDRLEKIMSHLEEITSIINDAETPLQKRILLLETIGNLIINVKKIPLYETLGIIEAIKLNIMMTAYPSSTLVGQLIKQYTDMIERNK